MASIDAIDLKKNYIIRHEGAMWKVVSTEHIKPGKGGAFMQVEIKNIKNGIKSNPRFRSQDKIDRLISESVDAQFLYKSGDNFVLMRMDTYEETEISKNTIGEDSDFLHSDIMVKINIIDDEIVDISLPSSVVLEVIDTEPQIKGATATSLGKPAILSNGITISVPAFITSGEKIRVRTEDRVYIEKA